MDDRRIAEAFRRVNEEGGGIAAAVEAQVRGIALALVRAGILELDALKAAVAEAEKNVRKPPGSALAYGRSMRGFWDAVEGGPVRAVDMIVPGRTYGDLGVAEVQLPAGQQASGSQPSESDENVGNSV